MPFSSIRASHVLLLALPLLPGCEGEGEPPDPSRYPLIPRPAEVQPQPGEFTLGPETTIHVSSLSDPELDGVVKRWASEVRKLTGLPMRISETGPPDAGERGISIRVSAPPRVPDEANPTGTGLPGIKAEAYRLQVSRKGVELLAATNAGVFYGLGTLGQLLHPVDSSALWRASAISVEDQPRFPYRGMHLDVGRHFFPVPFIKRYIDLMASYKMNVFHWHLTEDQGWRLEIQAYPRLTTVGACRRETMVEKNFDPFIGDGTEYCGFYSQEQVREIVEYARERFVTVIPEIEMPGHSVAALAAYPELACSPGPFQVATRWGVTRDIYCPKEETFDFLEDVLSEVMELFPSRYIHIGGDEAPKTAWERSQLAQEVMRREGLADEEELQSWFIRRIETFLNAHGRRLVGWDEILEGGLAPGATVMSWRGMSGGIEAAKQGHDVIMTPTGFAYFDYYQGDTLQEPLAIGGFTPLERVYAFEPVPSDLTPLEALRVLGGQGNVWTEYIKTPEHLEYMAVPRMLALSEVVWSPSEVREWNDFTRRLPRHLARLGSQGVNYRIPDVLGLEEDVLVLSDSTVVQLAGAVEGGSIHYTLDGSTPGPSSPRYRGPFAIHLDAGSLEPGPLDAGSLDAGPPTIRPLSGGGIQGGIEVAARLLLPDGREGPVRRARFSRTRLAPSAFLPWRIRRQGLEVQALAGRFRSVQDLDTGRPLPLVGPGDQGRSRVPRVQLPEGVPETGYGLLFNGFIRVPAKGIYTFHLSSDDGSRLVVGKRTVVDHDGPHTSSTRSGSIALHRGWHPLSIRYFQAGGGQDLRLELEGPGLSRREIPAHWLAHESPSEEASRLQQ